MKEKPIGMTEETVCALLRGEKTQTRRRCKVRKDGSVNASRWAVGDVLWVKETYAKPDRGKPLYRADRGAEAALAARAFNAVVRPLWAPLLFMPRRYSRITLRVTDVRIEPLQWCSDADAAAEGCRPGTVAEYRALWERIQGPGSWDVNPNVWVIDFEILQ